MALTVTSLAAALRAGDGTAAPAEPFAGILTRLLEVGTAMVEKLAPDAPEAVADEAVVRFSGYLYDSPEAAPGAAYAAAWRNSGAQSLVAPWVARRAVSVEAAAAAAASTSSTSTGGPGVDETARAAAAEARTIADANAAKLMPVPPAEADAATATTIRGWTAAAVRRVVEAIVPAWARAPNAPSGGGGGGGTTLPASSTATEQGLFSRAGSLFWRIVNEVPNGPGEFSAVGHALTVIGENDRDYAWRAIADATARANAALNAGNISELETTVNNDRLALAALETALPDPPVPAAEAVVRTYALQVPARSGRARWVAAGGAATDQAARDAVTAEAMTRASADTALGARIDTEATTRALADTALGVRIDALTAPIADPVFAPAYWVKSRDAHTLIVHLDPATLVTEVASIRVVVAGVGVNVSKVADQDVYAFVFDAANSATITASAGNAGRDTVTAEVILRDSSTAEVRRWRIVLRVLDEAPSAGGGGVPAVEVLLAEAAVTNSSAVGRFGRIFVEADDHKLVYVTATSNGLQRRKRSRALLGFGSDFRVNQVAPVRERSPLNPTLRGVAHSRVYGVVPSPRGGVSHKLVAEYDGSNWNLSGVQAQGAEGALVVGGSSQPSTVIGVELVG